MALANSRSQREYDKFIERADGQTSVAVDVEITDKGGGGSSTAKYRATSNGCDGVVAYASATTLTVTGTPFTINSEDIVYIREVDATGNTCNLWVNGTSSVHIEISGTTLTRSGGSDFSADGVYEVGYNGQDKAYDSAATAFKQFETSPVSSHHVEETLADVTNETSGTNYYYVDMDGYKNLGIQIDTSGAAPTDTLTITFEGSLQDDGTAPASCFYTDITAMFYDGATNALGTASWVDVDVAAWLTEAVAGTFKYIRVKTVTAGGNNDADYVIYAKRAY